MVGLEDKIKYVSTIKSQTLEMLFQIQISLNKQQQAFVVRGTMMQPFISIIIPVFNTEDYISECLDSVINQTEKDLEIIVVDDGTPDNSGIIADQYAKADNRIKVIHKENGGQSSARNAGIRAAGGKYVLFLDSDDWLELNAVEILKSIAEENNYDTVMFTWENIDKSNDLKTRPASVFEEGFIFNEKDKATIYEKFCTGYSLNSVWQRIYKREILVKNDLLFDEEQKYMEDLIFSFDFFVSCKNGIYIDEIIYKYRHNPKSLTHTFKTTKFGFIKRGNLLLASKIKSVTINDTYDYMLALRFTIECFDILPAVVMYLNKQNKKDRNDYVSEVINDDYFQECASKVNLKDIRLIHRTNLLFARNKMIKSLWFYNRILFSKLSFRIKSQLGL